MAASKSDLLISAFLSFGSGRAIRAFMLQQIRDASAALLCLRCPSLKGRLSRECCGRVASRCVVYGSFNRANVLNIGCSKREQEDMRLTTATPHGFTCADQAFPIYRRAKVQAHHCRLCRCDTLFVLPSRASQLDIACTLVRVDYCYTFSASFFPSSPSIATVYHHNLPYLFHRVANLYH